MNEDEGRLEQKSSYRNWDRRQSIRTQPALVKKAETSFSA